MLVAIITIPTTLFNVFADALFAITAAIFAHMNVNATHKTRLTIQAFHSVNTNRTSRCLYIISHTVSFGNGLTYDVIKKLRKFITHFFNSCH